MRLHFPPVASTVRLPRLREIREREALTQMELAQKAGISQTTISGAEMGHVVKLPTVRRLAAALGVKPRELMEE